MATTIPDTAGMASPQRRSWHRPVEMLRYDKRVQLFFRNWHRRRSAKGIKVKGLSVKGTQEAMKGIYGLPHTRVRWSAALLGAVIVTALLFQRASVARARDLHQTAMCPEVVLAGFGLELHVSAVRLHFPSLPAVTEHDLEDLHQTLA